MNPSHVEREARLLLRRLARPGGRLIAHGVGWALAGAKGEGAVIAAGLVKAMWTQGLLLKEADGGYRISAAGNRCLGGGVDAEAVFAQHRPVEAAGQSRGGPSVNAAESPLAWLRGRKGKGGAVLLSEEEFEAGERLRRDFTLAQMEPRVTSSWEAVVNSGARGRSMPRPESLMVSERAMAAKGRFFDAADAVGPELSSILFEICCLAHGIEAAERRLGLPQRSGKVVLRLALAALARHYGLIRPASGALARPRHWGGEGYRPRIGGAAE